MYISANDCAKFLKLGSTVIAKSPYSCKARLTAVFCSAFVGFSLSLQLKVEKIRKAESESKLIFLIIFIRFYTAINTKSAINNK